MFASTQPSIGNITSQSVYVPDEAREASQFDVFIGDTIGDQRRKLSSDTTVTVFPSLVIETVPNTMQSFPQPIKLKLKGYLDPKSLYSIKLADSAYYGSLPSQAITLLDASTPVNVTTADLTAVNADSVFSSSDMTYILNNLYSTSPDSIFFVLILYQIDNGVQRLLTKGELVVKRDANTEGLTVVS
jgi:hypothetical protein